MDKHRNIILAGILALLIVGCYIAYNPPGTSAADRQPWIYWWVLGVVALVILTEGVLIIMNNSSHRQVTLKNYIDKRGGRLTVDEAVKTLLPLAQVLVKGIG
jgi:uncharacterized integral membrane protein